MQVFYTRYALRDELIEESALMTRQLCRVNGSRSFNICEIIENELIPRYKEKGDIKIKFYDRAEGSKEPPAKVQFGKMTKLGHTPTILYVDREIWNKAKTGDPKSRFILAHEIGHIILHNYGVAQFSNQNGRSRGSTPKEQDLEHHADHFAGHFLFPDEEVIKILTTEHDLIDSIEYLCRVDAETAHNRITEVKKRECKRQSQTSNAPCSFCGEFSVENLVCRNCKTEQTL